MNKEEKRIYDNKRLYDKYMEIISYFTNDEILELAKSLIDYVENDV